MRSLLSVTIMLLLAVPAVAQDYNKGLVALLAGDYAAAIRELRPLAEQGNADAQFMLGAMYADGQGVPQDDAEAVKWYRLAAEQGHVEAQHNLGAMYADGRGVPQDDAEAVRWFRLAAEQGLAEAQLSLGATYADGRGVPQDYVQAHMWLNLAAAQGNKTAAEFRQMLAARMTPAQIAEAQRLAREKKNEWIEKFRE